MAPESENLPLPDVAEVPSAEIVGESPPESDSMQERRIAVIRNEVAGTVSWTLTIISLLISAFSLFFMMLVVPQFMRVFDDMRMSLPVVTHLIGSPYATLLVIGAAAAGLWKEYALKDKITALRWSGAHLVLLLLLDGLVAIATIMPLVELIRGLQS